jgi:hypothetical protein
MVWYFFIHWFCMVYTFPPPTYGVSFGPLGTGYRAMRVFDSGWIEYFGVRVYIESVATTT